MGAEVRSLHSPKRDHVAATRVTNDVGAFLRNHADGRAQGTKDGSVSSTHCVSPLLLQTARNTKLLPVVQLRSGVILLMGDPNPGLPSSLDLRVFARASTTQFSRPQARSVSLFAAFAGGRLVDAH